VPELASDTDTDYFEQPYSFYNDEVASVMMDSTECTQVHQPEGRKTYYSVERRYPRAWCRKPRAGAGDERIKPEFDS
jgi:hypothetical protein